MIDRPRRQMDNRRMDFLKYWKENFKAANGWLSFLNFIISSVAWLIFALCKMADLSSPSEKIFTSISWIAGVLFFGLGFLFLPFRRHEADKKIHKAEITRLTAQCTEAKSQIEAKVKTRQIKDSLGEFIQVFEKRINTIGKADVRAYETILEIINGRPTDRASLDLINHVYQFIKDSVGTAEAELFNSDTELSKDDSLERQIALPAQHVPKFLPCQQLAAL